MSAGLKEFYHISDLPCIFCTVLVKYDMLVSVLGGTKLCTYYECRKCEKIEFMIY